MARKIFDLCYTQNRELSWLKFNQHVLEDNVKARRLCADGNYVPVGAEGLCDVQQILSGAFASLSFHCIETERTWQTAVTF